MPRRFERHSRTKWDWGLPSSRSSEVRAASRTDPEPAKRAPGRKDTKRWCRGKEGVEHQVTVVLHKYASLHGCGWSKSGHWVRAGPVPPRGVTLPKWPRNREWVVTGQTWRCFHEYQCTACGKFLGPVPQCPDQLPA
jgi:hypothetical protein